MIRKDMPDKYSEHLNAVLTKTGKNYDLNKINRAYEYAKELHAGQFRKDGSEYISHPVAVAEIVAGLGLDTDSVCAALLHDTVEDCQEKVDIEKIRKDFGQSVVELVEGLTKLVRIPFESQEEQHMENLRKMFLAMAKDVRVIFIKLCDRLHNMRTLNAKPEERRRIIALETMNVYAPLAHRLGMQRIKQELENLALSYLDPIGYAEVSSAVARLFASGLTPRVRILCRRSQSLMKMTRISFDMARSILRMFSILASSLSSTLMAFILVRPSTSMATSSPKRFRMISMLVLSGQSSTVSCRNAAQMESVSSPRDATISATAIGWEI